MNAAVQPDLAIAQKALDKAKIGLMSRPDSAFFTTVCFSLVHKWDPHIPTACTNGREIRYNPAFFLALDTEEQIFLLLHETLHVALMHMGRLYEREPKKWNYATDYVINLMLTDRGYKMPQGGLLDEKWRDMTSEEVYAKLPDDPSQSNSLGQDLEEPAGGGEGEGSEEGGSSSGQVTQGQVPDTIGGKEQAAAQLEEEIADILVRAQTQSQMSGDAPGTIPQSIQVFLDKLLNPVLPWDRLLRKYMTEFAKTDYSWRRPNRRFFPRHYLPSLYDEQVGEVAIAVDMSASVSDAETLRFISEVQGILKRLKPKSIRLLQFDTSIKSIETLKTPAELSRVEFKGRGGTHIGEIMDWAVREKPLVMLVFSDGYFHFRDIDMPKCPVLWIIHDNEKFSAPHGKVIHYNL